jgi:CHAT domain-containing protein/tetratricopeptide (TPR) repeat protein
LPQNAVCEFVMFKSSQWSVIPRVWILALFSLCFPSIANPQDKAASSPSLPAELTAADPEIRALLNFENEVCKPGGNAERATNVEKALQMADSRGLIADRAIAESALASVLIGEGKIDMAFLAFQKALQDSIDAKNDVLEANILIALASEAQMKGNISQALELVSRALSLSERNGSLYAKAHALGELGRLNLLMGKTSEADNSIDEALNIDRLNGYKFEALHLVFKSYYLGLTGRDEQAVELLAQAKTKAILTRNTYAFLMAENAYAFGLVKRGRTDEAIGEMELVRKGDLRTFGHEAGDLDCVASALELPIMHILFLEGLTNVLEAANLKEKEIEVWREVLSTSHNIGLVAGEAEAEQKIAQLESQLKKFEDAVKDYALTVGLYRSLQNEVLLNQVEVSESALLIQLGRGMEALPLVHEIVSYARNEKMRPLEFLANLALAEIYQPAGDLKLAREALERAESLIRPGPFDAEIDNHSVHEAYVRLSDIYRALKIPSQELVSTERAFSVSVHLKDEESQHTEVAYLDQRLNELHIRELVEEKQKEGELAESLLYSYILLIRDGAPSKLNDNQSNWQRIMSLPFQITQKPDGAAALIKILDEVGPLVVIEKLPILTSLARYYISYGSDPVLAEKYALEGENLIKQLQGDMTSLKSESSCILAISYSHQGKIALAKERIEECTSLAKKTEDRNTIAYSDAANVLVQTQVGNLAAAKASLENWVVKAPDNPEFHVELAMSLASAQLYDEASARLDFAIQKLVSLADKKAAAAAYRRVAMALNSDQSEKAQGLQLLYLNSAQQLYHELGAQAEEAETLVALGDYYLKLPQVKAAINEYQTAVSLAQKAAQPAVVAEGLLGLGNGYKAQREFGRASEYHLEAASACRGLNNPAGEVLSLINLADDYQELGDTDRALTSFLEAKKAAEKAPAFSKYFVDYSLGGFYQSQGQFEKALTTFNEAVEITTQVGDIGHSGYSHLAIAQLSGEIGAWDDALTESQIALDLFQGIGSREGQAASWATLTGIYCDRTSSLKDFDKAQACYTKAQDFGYGKALQLDLMEIYVQTGKYSEAAKIASETLAECKTSQSTGCEAHALISLSEAKRLEGNLKAARSALDEARPSALKSQELYLHGRFLYAEARLQESEGKVDESLASYKQVISLIESVKGNLNAKGQGAISENYGYIYDELVSLLYSMSKENPTNRLRYASDALQYAEINKATQFAKSWGRRFVNQMRLALPPVIQERERALLSKRERILSQLEVALNDVGPNQRAQRSGLEAELSLVQAQIEAFLIELRTTFPQYAAVAYPEKIQISTLPLRKGETLVEFKMTDDSTYVWVIQKREANENSLEAFYEIRRKRGWFLDRLSLLRNGLNSGRPGGVDWKISEEIFAELFPAEVATVIRGSQEVIFVPDDVLFVLPFELFSPGASIGNFVFLRKAATYYPSAVSFRLARTAGHQANWREAFLGIADPITSPEDDRFKVVGVLKSPEQPSLAQMQNLGDEKKLSDPERLKARGFSLERLPGTAIEVQGIATLLRERNETVDVRSGASATKNEFMDTDLSKFRFVHFATHGVLPVDTDIKEPSLVLSYDGVARSHMFLSMSEIIGLKLRSESVVLSACNTGSGKISRAEGVMSLGRAFLAAGSSSVTVSLWRVSDESTALLMKKYYDGLLANKKKSVALAEARNAVFESGSKDPFFWAPFIVVGE